MAPTPCLHISPPDLALSSRREEDPALVGGAPCPPQACRPSLASRRRGPAPLLCCGGGRAAGWPPADSSVAPRPACFSFCLQGAPSDEDLRLLREAAGCGDVREAWGSYETLMIAHGVPRSTNRSYRIALNSELGPLLLLRRAALDQPLVPHGSRLRAGGGGAARRDPTKHPKRTPNTKH